MPMRPNKEAHAPSEASSVLVGQPSESRSHLWGDGDSALPWVEITSPSAVGALAKRQIIMDKKQN